MVLGWGNEVGGLGRGGGRREEGGGGREEGWRKEDGGRKEDGRREEGGGGKRDEVMKKGSILRNSVISLGIKKFEGNSRLSVVTDPVGNRKRKEEGGEGGKRDEGGRKEEGGGRKDEGGGRKEESGGKKEEGGGKDELGELGWRREEEEGRLEGFEVILSVLNYKSNYGFDISCGNEGFVWTNSASKAVFGLVTVLMGGGVVLNGAEGIGKRETVKVKENLVVYAYDFNVYGLIVYVNHFVVFFCFYMRVLYCFVDALLYYFFIDACRDTWANSLH